jgi:hypothetical protein
MEALIKDRALPGAHPSRLDIVTPRGGRHHGTMRNATRAMTATELDVAFSALMATEAQALSLGMRGQKPILTPEEAANDYLATGATSNRCVSRSTSCDTSKEVSGGQGVGLAHEISPATISAATSSDCGSRCA